MKFKIVFFDCDGVLLFGNPLGRLGEASNLPQIIYRKWAQDYHSHKISFDEWVENIDSCYKKAGLNKKKYEEIIDLKQYEINKEAKDLIGYLKEKSYEIAIISSGSEEYVSLVADHFGIKYYRINTIMDFDDNGLFVKLKTFGEDPDVKVMQINEICEMLNIAPTETIFIGDSDNDLKAFEHTKHGILYKTKDPRFEKIAWKRVDDLREVIKILENAD